MSIPAMVDQQPMGTRTTMRSDRPTTWRKKLHKATADKVIAPQQLTRKQIEMLNHILRFEDIITHLDTIQRQNQ